MVDLSLTNYTAKTQRDIIKDEYKKCVIDPVYFIKKYCYIQHPLRGKILFNLYDFQERCLYDFRDHDYNIVLKSRQLGISTLCAGIIIWTMVFNDNKQCTILATKQTTAKNLVTKVRYMYDNLPEWMVAHLGEPDEHNKLSLKLSNGSEVTAISAASDSARSLAASLVVIDEAAFIDEIRETWTAAQPTMSTGGKCIVLSTPNGTNNWFYEQWEEAELGQGKFHPIRLDWTVHPERDQKWREEQNAALGIKAAAQECDAQFLSSGNSIIDLQLLDAYFKTRCEDPLEKRGIDGNIYIWKYPDYTKSYVVVADVARGDSSDYSTFHVLDVENVEQVAEYQGQMGTADFGNLLVNIATEYNDALLVIENSNVGWAAIQPALDRNYQNLFYSSRDLNYVDIQHQIGAGKDLRDKSTMIPGFSTTTKNRPLIISKLIEYMNTDVPIIKSKRLISELKNFIWKGSKAEAASGKHDDLVMAFSIGLWVRDTALKLRQQGIELQRKSVDLINRSLPVYSRLTSQNNPWVMRTGKDTEDISWLIK